jgi:probable F420-dependent oxidoreductase
MNVGVFLGDQPFGSDDPGGFLRIAQAAEAAGFDSVWLGDHPVRPVADPTTYPYDASGRRPQRTEDSLFDPIVTLAYLAGATSRIALGTAVYILPLRHPLVTAREVMTLDRASGGRVLFGVGAGWLEQEFRALGVPFQGRGRRMDDAIHLLRRLWTEDVVRSDSDVYPFDPVVFRPPPLQRPHPPILIGGHSPAAIRRAVRLGDGWIPVAPELDELAQLLRSLEAALAAAGRSRDGFIVNARTPALPTAADLERYEQLGVNGVRVHGAHLAGLPLHECTVDNVLRGVERFGRDVLARG